MNTNYLLSGKFQAVKNNSTQAGKIKAIDTLLILLSQIDYKSEVVPFNNLERFSRLLTSLKGKPLNKVETELVAELVNG